MNEIIKIVTIFFSSFGFALLFNINKKFVLQGAFGGLVVYGVYILMEKAGLGVFQSSFVSACVCSIYAQINARVNKAPSVVFYIPAIVPLIPGSSLYYSILNIVNGNKSEFIMYAISTAKFAFGISAGVTLISALMVIFNSYMSTKTIKK